MITFTEVRAEPVVFNNGNAFGVEVKYKLSNGKEGMLPVVWTKKDILQAETGKQVNGLLFSLLENSFNSLGDMLEFYNREEIERNEKRLNRDNRKGRTNRRGEGV